MSERFALNDRIEKLLDAYRARIRVEIAKEHEASKAAVLAQQKKIADHHAAITELTRELNRAAEKKGLAFAARDAAQEEQRRLSRYENKQAHKRAAELVAKREAEADVAAQEHGTIQQRINYMNLVDLKPLHERLNELMGDEARLNHHVTGAGYTTDLGIVVSARPPL